jgi:hypothetical protein
MPKLTDSQLIVLSKAAGRNDGAAVAPRGMGKAAAGKITNHSINRAPVRHRLSLRDGTGLCTPETEIGKSPPETGARNPPRKSRNARNCGPETGAPQPNLRECRRFSPTGK